MICNEIQITEQQFSVFPRQIPLGLFTPGLWYPKWQSGEKTYKAKSRDTAALL